MVPWRPGKAAIDYFLVAGLARAEIRSGRVEAPMIAAAVVLGALIDILAFAVEHHVALSQTLSTINFTSAFRYELWINLHTRLRYDR